MHNEAVHAAELLRMSVVMADMTAFFLSRLQAQQARIETHVEKITCLEDNREPTLEDLQAQVRGQRAEIQRISPSAESFDRIAGLFRRMHATWAICVVKVAQFVIKGAQQIVAMAATMEKMAAMNPDNALNHAVEMIPFDMT